MILYLPAVLVEEGPEGGLLVSGLEPMGPDPLYEVTKAANLNSVQYSRRE